MSVLTRTRARPVHPEREHAAALLNEHGYGVSEVISVDRDSVLYRDGYERPRTAWITVDPQTRECSIRIEPGFVAECHQQ